MACTSRFPAAKVIDKNGIDVSEAGQAVLKLVAGTAKKENAKVRIFARTSSALPPKELRKLFKTTGEMRAVRAARVMSALQAGGAVAQRRRDCRRSRQACRARAWSQGPPPAPPDRLDLEVEPG